MLANQLLLAAAAAIIATLTTSANGQAYMKEPTCRGCNAYGSQLLAIQSPNTSGQLCRGAPQGQISIITGNSVNVTLEVSNSLPGSCAVELLDENLSNPMVIGRRDQCVTTSGETTWTVPLPSGINGHKVLRWSWNATNQDKPEQYEQCADVTLGNTDGNKIAATKGGFATALLPVNSSSTPSGTAPFATTAAPSKPRKRCKKKRVV
ncbi:hypothetical protein BDF19DRAFT_46305 [Syncephalis fuscata]|nr:hypothetical protein BDF19DRAFT_46305 [Syncephalis fuscata]